MVGRGLGNSPGMGGALSHTRLPSRMTGKVKEKGVLRGDRSAGSVGEDRPGSAIATTMTLLLSSVWGATTGAGGGAVEVDLQAVLVSWIRDLLLAVLLIF